MSEQDRLLGELTANVSTLAIAVGELKEEVQGLRDAHTYGKGMLAGLLLVAGSTGAGLAHAAMYLKDLMVKVAEHTGP